MSSSYSSTTCNQYSAQASMRTLGSTGEDARRSMGSGNR
jgi:hypothetical protein